MYPMLEQSLHWEATSLAVICSMVCVWTCWWIVSWGIQSHRSVVSRGDIVHQGFGSHCTWSEGSGALFADFSRQFILTQINRTTLFALEAMLDGVFLGFASVADSGQVSGGSPMPHGKGIFELKS